MTEEKKIDKVVKNKTNKRSSKGKDSEKRSRFNVLDFLIIVCILSVAVLLFFVYSPFNLVKLPSDEAEVIYSIRFSGVPSEYASKISVGDKVIDENGYELGVIASTVEVEPHTMYIFDASSRGIKAVVHPESVNLIITVSATAEVNDDGYLIDGRRIAVEGVYKLFLPGFEGEGICVSLSEENANDAGGVK